MERNINSLNGYSMVATDGEIGKVIEFYFDDETWFIRYMILETGAWLPGRKMLISPDALKKTSWRTGLFSVNITKEQLRNSPAIDTDKPVYRSQEIELYAHYDWESDWGSQFYEGGTMGNRNPDPVLDRKILSTADKADIRSNDELHLQNTAKILGFQIHGTDGELGSLVDLVMDDQTWQILYIVAETGISSDEKKVLIDIKNIQKVQWDQANILVDVTLATLKNGKPFKESEFKPDENSKA
jgi:hypothetical protein